MNEAIILALTDYLPLVLPEAVLGVVACVLFLGATWRGGRSLWGGAALVGLGLAAAALVYTAVKVPTVQRMQERIDEIPRQVDEIKTEKTICRPTRRRKRRPRCSRKARTCRPRSTPSATPARW